MIQDKPPRNTGTSAGDKAGPEDAAMNKATNFLHPSWNILKELSSSQKEMERLAGKILIANFYNPVKEGLGDYLQVAICKKMGSASRREKNAFHSIIS